MQKPVVALLSLLPLVLLGAGACGGAGDSSVNGASGGSGGEGPVGCNSSIAYSDVGVIFKLACVPNDLTAATVSGPCASNTGGDLTDSVKGNELSFASPSAGVCHLELTFASGFSYGADVTFTSTTDSCGRSFTSPTQSPFAVDNPSSTCADGGSAAGAAGAGG